MSRLDERLDLAEQKLKEPKFRENRGLGNEVGYYIFDYPAEEEMYVRERITYIKKRNQSSGDEYQIVIFDLYDIMIEILEKKKYLEKCYSIMKVNSTDGLIVKYILEHTPDKAIIFITGIGKCYPIIRSHTVLNNLHLVIDNVPVVLFYPGKYDGQELVLFNEIKDDNYYRAFKLVQ